MGIRSRPQRPSVELEGSNCNQSQPEESDYLLNDMMSSAKQRGCPFVTDNFGNYDPCLTGEPIVSCVWKFVALRRLFKPTTIDNLIFPNLKTFN
jgi:hypothetical protein